MALREIRDAPLNTPEQVRTAVADMLKKLNEIVKEVNRIANKVDNP